MKRVHRLGKIEKSKLFSQKQAESLSGFSRAQLIKWEEVGIIKPQREYAILYDWNQLIFLRILYYLRQRWSFKTIEKALKEYELSIDEIVKKITKFITVNFGEFGIEPDTKILIQFYNLSNTESDIQERRLINHLSQEQFPLKFEFGRQTQLTVPQIVNELRQIAEELQIENFYLKVG